MMHPLWGALLAVALTVQPSLSSAGEVLTETDFLRRLEGAPPHRSASDAALEAVLEGDVRLAEARALVVAQWPNPDLEISREALDFGNETVEETVEVTVAWTPPRPGVRRHQRAAAESGIAAARAHRDARRVALRAELRGIYARWALAVARVEVRKDQVATLAKLAEQARRRAEAGEATGLAARRLALAAAAVRADLVRAEGEHDRARAGIGAWLGDLPSTTQPALPELLDGVDGVGRAGALAPGGAMPPGADLEADPETHSDLVALAAEWDAARWTQAALEPRFALPRVAIGWQREEGDGRRFDGPVVGLGWSVPLTHPRRGDRATAAVRTETLEARLTLARRRLEAERAGALAAYHRIRPAVAGARGIAAEAATAVVAVTRAYHLGEAPLTDLLDTVRAAAEAQLIALELLDETLAAYRELERLMGKTVGEKTP